MGTFGLITGAVAVVYPAGFAVVPTLCDQATLKSADVAVPALIEDAVIP